VGEVKQEKEMENREKEERRVGGMMDKWRAKGRTICKTYIPLPQSMRVW